MLVLHWELDVYEIWIVALDGRICASVRRHFA